MSEIKKTWSIPTSPRSPYKLSDELDLLKAFENSTWDKETQRSYAEKLGASDFFEGKVSQKYPDFSARDRINRSPKTFGFVRFDLDRKVRITKAGSDLIKTKGSEELFLRQLLKWQYPSPNHSGLQYQYFRIKPFLEVLRLAYELDGLSKKEIAIFCVPFIDYRNYNEVKSAILDFRSKISSVKNIERKRYLITAHVERFKLVYADEIDNGTFKLRQQKEGKVGKDEFIKTKIRNSIDYADAAIRYFRATGLFKLSATTFRLRIVDSKRQLVKEILDTTDREPLVLADEHAFLDFLGDSEKPALPDDRPEIIQTEIAHLIEALALKSLLSKGELDLFREEKLVSASVVQLKETRQKLEKILSEDSKNIQLSALHSYSLFDDILKMYDKIVNRADYDIPDKPLFFEWNTWRAFTMLDDGEIVCNAILDTEGKPLSTAPGGGSDGVAYYEDFVMTIEVTLARGVRQFETECESVPRHVGKMVSKLRAASDERPVYGFFLASGLNESTVAHFFSLKKSNILHYGGRVKVIPLDLSLFKKMLIVAKENGGVKREHLLSFLKWADEEADRVGNEVEWYQSIERKIPTWVK